jgi:hypothetical protein
MVGLICWILSGGRRGAVWWIPDPSPPKRKKVVVKFRYPRAWGTVITVVLSLVIFPDIASAVSGDAPNALTVRPDSSVTWRNIAEIRNLHDGTSRNTVAFQVNSATSEMLIAENSATAEANCARCRSVSFAFQIGLVNAVAPTVDATNKSLAVNERRCDNCVTLAVADQFLLVTDKPFRLTAAGQARLQSVDRRLRMLARSSSAADVLRREVDALRAEVVQILSTETRQAQRHGVLRLNRMEDGPRGRHSEHLMQPAG